MYQRIQPSENDRIACHMGGATIPGTLLKIHSNTQLYCILLDGELRARTVQWWQVTKLITLVDIVIDQTPQPVLPPRQPWWKRIFFCN